MKLGELEAALGCIADDYFPAALASSLSAEDMVLTDVVARLRLPVEVFVLDTGRLHAETLSLVQETRKRFGIDVRVYRPEAQALDQYVRVHGCDAFYSSVELRQRCCTMRKVEPLKRALKGKRAWITGQRREHSSGRAQLAEREFDAANRLEKFNPLATWSETEVWDYVHARGVPYNALYDQGYRSIGCAPCTRPVLPHEDVRAGRWWWENAGHTECGLHVKAVS